MHSVFPGKELREEYLEPRDETANAPAEALHVHAERINDFVLKLCGVMPDTALRLTRYFSGADDDAQGWINMQITFGFEKAQAELSTAIAEEVQPRQDSAATTA